jgi:hypothetical protein
MSVKVICPRATQTNAISTGTDQYEKAENIRIEDGHLFVVGANLADPYEVLAIYAPGKWINASTAA